MADIKFACAHCGQHISCDELWAGHELQCPACQDSLTVPQLQQPQAAAVPDPPPMVTQAPAPGRARLAPGATQVARPSPTAAPQQRRLPPRPPKTKSPLLGYAVLVVVLGVVGLLAYNYVPALLNQAQDIGSSSTSGSAAAPAAGGAGPLGEVNGAMDVSDAMEGGGSSSRPRAIPPRPQTAGQRSTTALTNSASGSVNGSLRQRSGQPAPSATGTR